MVFERRLFPISASSASLRLCVSNPVHLFTMKQHPLYYAFGIFAAIYLSLANARGWSFFHSINPGHWFGGGRGSSFSHK